MKRFYLFVLCVFASLPVLAKNKISMVTYFPVPYVAYSQVNTTKQLDIGLTSTCDMKLGCSEDSATLNAGQVNLKGGKLNLDGGRGISGGTLSLGSGVGEGKISFRNVRIQTGNLESVNAEDIKATNLNLFGKSFPSCKSANSESNGQMQWASLKLKGASSSELYLTCGSMGESAACQPTDSRGETYTENCPAGQTGGPLTYTWNYDLCRYLKSGSCTQSQYTCVTGYQWKTVDIVRDPGMQDTPAYCDLSDLAWSSVGWTTSMVCGNETTHNGYTIWDEMENCTPGQYYLYVDTYACRPGGDSRCPASAYGYYCLKCGTVSSEADCVQKSEIRNMYGAPCSDSGGSVLPDVKPVTPGDIMAP